MIGKAILMLAVIALASPAFAEWNTNPGGPASSVVTSVAKGQCVYERMTATGQGALLQLPNVSANIKVTANVAGAQVGDVVAEIRECPHGTLSYSANVCEIRYYKDKDGLVTAGLDGDGSTGTDALYGVRAPVIVMNWTTHPGAGRVAQTQVCIDEQ
jgi:hypothetical protein